MASVKRTKKGGINRGFRCGVVALTKVCHKRRVVFSSQAMVFTHYARFLFLFSLFLLEITIAEAANTSPLIAREFKSLMCTQGKWYL